MNPHAAAPIVEVEERLRQAMLTSDVAELDALIAPELLFTSYLGQLITKQQDLEMHRSRVLQLTELTPSDPPLPLHARFAVVSVQMHLVGNYDGTPIDQHIRFTRVWAVSSAGVWQIVAGHASLIAT